jgi:flagellar export protein FliJ
MAFDFPLAAVLRYRGSLEQQEYLLFEKLQQEISQVELNIRAVEEARLQANQTRAAELTKGMPAIEMQAAFNYERALDMQREALQTRWQEVKVKWRRQLAAYELARRNRETLEKLRDRQLELYTRERAKLEQAAVDDIFSARHSANARRHE